MAASPVPPVDIGVEPDLQPLYPTPAQIAHLLSPYVGLSPQQKAELVSHCLTRACQFGDMLILSHLLTDPNAHPFVDLAKREEDGLGLISTTILGFGSESEKDIEREECFRLLVSEGCDVTTADQGTLEPPFCLCRVLMFCRWLDTPSLRGASGNPDPSILSPYTWGFRFRAHASKANSLGYRHRSLHSPRAGRYCTDSSRGNARRGLEGREDGGATATTGATRSSHG